MEFKCRMDSAIAYDSACNSGGVSVEAGLRLGFNYLYRWIQLGYFKPSAWDFIILTNRGLCMGTIEALDSTLG